jgi:hypothetical protein
MIKGTLPLKARVQDKAICIFWLDKWRPLRYWGRNTLPKNKAIIEDVLRIFRLNAGMDAGQPIQLNWITE